MKISLFSAGKGLAPPKKHPHLKERLKYMKRFVIGILVTNEAGALTRISGMFARRSFNIESLTVGVTEDPNISRMTIVMNGDDSARDQIIRQLSKIHSVKEIKEMNPESSVNRELIIIKVKTTSETRSEIIDAVNVFRNSIIDYHKDAVSIEVTGDGSKLNAFIDLMADYGILEICRTGLISVDRGATTLKDSGCIPEH